MSHIHGRCSCHRDAAGPSVPLLSEFTYPPWTDDWKRPVVRVPRGLCRIHSLISGLYSDLLLITAPGVQWFERILAFSNVLTWFLNPFVIASVASFIFAATSKFSLKVVFGVQH
jgi:hypothetical protein